ncbi:LPO_1073/Vpar_1526 family protein [Carboxylicivirga marina]|uniref:LPO_1073/Vpar_1526 family protein n=1 Tax=Carboxylicivirga marina TaxID=2800988 RepID=UPI0025975466|nr:LPO_1073/Vpar_1526 family protein [uncultured Carboxylicivirga sp.]
MLETDRRKTFSFLLKMVGGHFDRRLQYDLFKQNFPDLLEEARKQAQVNFEEYDKKLDEAIKNRIDEIDFNKFKEPNTQYLLNLSISHAARKGTNIYLGILSEALAASLGKGNSEILNIVSEQALEIIPKLTSGQIQILTLIHWIASCNLEGVKSISHTEYKNSIVHAMTLGIPEEHYSHLNYMNSLGILTLNHLQKRQAYTAIKVNYDIYSQTNVNDVMTDIKKHSPSLAKMANIHEDKQLGAAYLTPVGMLIALISLRRIFPTLDYKIWIK